MWQVDRDGKKPPVVVRVARVVAVGFAVVVVVPEIAFAVPVNGAAGDDWPGVREREADAPAAGGDRPPSASASPAHGGLSPAPAARVSARLTALPSIRPVTL